MSDTRGGGARVTLGTDFTNPRPPFADVAPNGLTLDGPRGV